MNLFASKDDLIRWLDSLLQERIVIAPVRVQGLTMFQPISKVEEIPFDFDNTTLSPKGWFLPPTETLFSCKEMMGRSSWSQRWWNVMRLSLDCILAMLKVLP